ncbi:MAG: molybdopterin cofactor-binding domain-containing protein [Hyphomicrobiaceae bacterium]
MALLGKSIPRREDAALLSGRGRYADDVPTPRRTLHAHVIRSPHARAKIISIDAGAALDLPGVEAIITGEEVRQLSDSFLVAVKANVPQWSLAVDEVRFVGEPVALVVADSRYLAEDAAELVEIEYETLPAVIDLRAARAKDAPLVHAAAGSNEVHTREFVYGEPEKAFADADRVVKLVSEYPRNSFMPMECFVVVAEHRPADDSYEVLANFQGPFSAHPVMARALRIPGTRFRVKTPADSGGSFGIKLSVFPFMVLMSIASKITGRPVKWVEDRLEHLVAASSGPNRITEIEAAVTNDGRILALKFDQIEDYGAFLRAPMPGPLYRMHGALTGAYDVQNLIAVNRCVLTNKAPSSLIRGFGGPQLYLALERLVQRIAIELGLEHIDVIRKNLIPAGAFPYRTAAGALYDSGDYPRCVEMTVGEGRLEDLKQRREAARKAGRYYGIGFATVVEPGMSNMGYLSTLLPKQVREKTGPKNGAISMATVNVDPLGAVSVTADVTVQGQGHETVLSQIVADELGLKIDDVTVNLEIDTGATEWSIAAGTYSCRFTPGTAVAAHIAAKRIKDKLAKIAAKQLNVLSDDVEFADGRIRSKSNPDNALAFGRAAGTAHWSPIMLPEGMEAGLRETAVWSPPELTPPDSDDRINTSLTYGLVFDMCGVEIDPVTCEVRVDRYISMHDAGRLLNPLIAEGQIRGAFMQGLASVLYEEFVYDEAGTFLTGTFADYLVPTAMELPELELMHIETPSPLTPLGAKGLAEGNCMSVPACVANAICDALNVENVTLPATPVRIHALIGGEEPARPGHIEPRSGLGPTGVAGEKEGRQIKGSGSVSVAAPPQKVWDALLDPENLKAVIPGCHSLEARGKNDYRAEVSLGVGPVRGRFKATVKLTDLKPVESGRLGGSITGPLGGASGSGVLRLSPEGDGTRIDYDYEVAVTGKAAAVGGRMLEGAAGLVINQFFDRFGRRLGGGGEKKTIAGRLGALWGGKGSSAKGGSKS